MPRGKLLTGFVNGILIVAIIIASFNGGWRLFLLILIPWLVWDLVRVFRGTTSSVRPEFAEPGQYRVILQTRGPQPILVIREIRRTTGRELVEAKKVLDDAPSIVAEGLSAQSAEHVAARLRKTGAKAVAKPIEENL